MAGMRQAIDAGRLEAAELTSGIAIERADGIYSGNHVPQNVR